MPLYVRIGMHLLFVSGVRLLAHESVDTLLVRESERQGRVYDQEGPEVRPRTALCSFLYTSCPS